MLLLLKLKIITDNEPAPLVHRFALQTTAAFVFSGIQYTKHIRVAWHSREHDTAGTQILKGFLNERKLMICSDQS